MVGMGRGGIRIEKREKRTMGGGIKKIIGKEMTEEEESKMLIQGDEGREGQRGRRGGK